MGGWGGWSVNIYHGSCKSCSLNTDELRGFLTVDACVCVFCFSWVADLQQVQIRSGGLLPEQLRRELHHQHQCLLHRKSKWVICRHASHAYTHAAREALQNKRRCDSIREITPWQRSAWAGCQTRTDQTGSSRFPSIMIHPDSWQRQAGSVWVAKNNALDVVETFFSFFLFF